MAKCYLPTWMITRARISAPHRVSSTCVRPLYPPLHYAHLFITLPLLLAILFAHSVTTSIYVLALEVLVSDDANT